MCARFDRREREIRCEEREFLLPDNHEDGAAARQPAADDAPQHLVVGIPLLDEDGVHIMEVG